MTQNQQDDVVRAQGLTKEYRSFLSRRSVEALTDLSFSVGRGEIFGLLGPNGSGKTTTIKLLIGLLRPTAGTATVMGKPAGDLAARARTGFLPEESYFYRFLTAGQILDFYARLFGIPKKERKEKIPRLIEQVGLSHARDRQLKEYSKGMVRRVGLAQTLLNDPDLVLLDEPTSGLDPIGSREVKDLILKIREEGKTVLVSSHLLADMESVCDRVAILDHGRLKKIGRVDELLTDRGVVQWEVEGLPPDAQTEIRRAIEARGGKVRSEGHPRERLEDLFLKTVEKQKESE